MVDRSVGDTSSCTRTSSFKKFLFYYPDIRDLPFQRRTTRKEVLDVDVNVDVEEEGRSQSIFVTFFSLSLSFFLYLFIYLFFFSNLLFPLRSLPTTQRTLSLSFCFALACFLSLSLSLSICLPYFLLSTLRDFHPRDSTRLSLISLSPLYIFFL